MQLTQFTDYALRTLLYVGAHPGRRVPIAEVSAAYGISNAHLVKVAGLLARAGFVRSLRGRGGGLELAGRPEDITVGAVVRACEPNFHLVECFDEAHGACPIAPVCGLAPVLAEAQRRFLATLDEHTLADLLTPRQTPRLVRLWRRTARA
jgi:Rrf2 family nitric oxide-sensitive transcriptional repressor